MNLYDMTQHQLISEIKQQREAAAIANVMHQSLLTWKTKTVTELEDLEARYKKAMEALVKCEELFEHAHPKFNWGASCLDAKAIQMLNETPLLVSKVLDEEGY